MSELLSLPSSVERVLRAAPRDLGGFSVRRTLPAPQRRMLGPFIFFDHLGPAEFGPNVAFDVRPHPHIALATLTYLFDGEIVHRDSLGSLQTIAPGDVNWMVAGSGIVHSERLSAEARKRGVRMHGIQCWVALPLDQEETSPQFFHVPRSALPRPQRAGVELDVIAGSAFGARSPVPVLSPTLYVHARLARDATLVVEEEHEERGVYVVEGNVSCEGVPYEEGSLLVLRPGAPVSMVALEPARVMLLGGAKLEGERHIFWNFVSSRPERIERAKQAWKAGAFPKVPGDELEFIPLPE